MSENTGNIGKPLKKLTPREEKYVTAFLSGRNQTQSAMSAGYAESTACARGSELMKRTHVRAAVDLGLAKIREESKYTHEAAMKDAEDAYQVARNTENANAMVKAAELKSRLNGLLIERQHHVVERVDLTAALEEARSRVRNIVPLTPLPQEAATRAYALLDPIKQPMSVHSENQSDTYIDAVVIDQTKQLDE